MERLTSLVTRMQAHRGVVREALAVSAQTAEDTTIASIRREHGRDLKGLFDTTDALYRLIHHIADDSTEH